MKVGITGWRGFIGSHLKEKIDHPILFKGDMTALDDVKVFVKECDRIYHLAGLNRADEGHILVNNLISTGNLILASRLEKVSPEIVFVSSKQVEWNKDSEYGLTKFIEENIVKTAKRCYIFRVPNVYGEGGKPFYNSVVATFCYQLAHGQKVTINNPEETREFVYVGDLVNELLDTQFLGYTDVKGEIMSIGEVYEYLTTKLGQHKNLKKCFDYYKKESKNVFPVARK